MTDFEERLMSSLRSAGADAPEGAGLADAARTRSRSRRRRTALASTAGIVAVVAVVGGVAWLGSGDDEDTTTVADDVTSTPITAPATRVETWHDVSVTVPASWGHGNLDDWCSSGESDGSPVVERPGAISIDILCTPMYGYGVQFSEAAASGFESFSPGTVNESVGKDYPAGSWQGWEQVGTTRVLVVAPTQAEAQQVLGSFEEVRDVDANGCAPRQLDDSAAIGADQVRLCRYVGGDLEQSEVLTGQDATDALAAFEAAPVGQMSSCPMSHDQAYISVSAGELSSMVEVGRCGGFDWGGERRQLTGDVLHWVLSPGWSGQVPDGITFTPRS